MIMGRITTKEKPASKVQLLNSEVYVVIDSTTGNVKVFADKGDAYEYPFKESVEENGVFILKCVIE